MTFRLLDQLSLPGDPAKANEDFLAQNQTAALVMDGATPLGDSLMPGPSDAAWIAQFGSRRLMARLEQGNGARKALREALADTQKSFAALRRHPPEEMWQTPCASMMLAVPDEDGVEFLWFGDCAALVMQDDAAVTVVGETFDKRAAEASAPAPSPKRRICLPRPVSAGRNLSAPCAAAATASTAAVPGCSVPMRGRHRMSRAG